ncbi:MAG: biotin carboxylase [Deltaproteobacteria bacterium]|jgi:acetyl-CoA carboxylase biotin carboxylase subunit|nr:biotin carboxylase [Deltaproteobacteria bacterium]
MFSKLAIANRGAVAARLVRAARDLGVRSVVLCSEADMGLPYAREADDKVVIGPAPPKESYLNKDKVVAAAKRAGAEAVHPGWGFLSEDSSFAQLAEDNGLLFIGPSPKWLEVMGDKVRSREMLSKAGLPAAPATGELAGSLEERAREAKSLGFPLLIKPCGGGGGIGMMPADSDEALLKALEAAESQALRGFGKGAVYAEKLLVRPRHVEFQVLCDKEGSYGHLLDRDCSVQRRRQKVIEEAGAPNLDRGLVAAMAGRAAEVLGELGYDHLGTLETLYSPQTGFCFLEVNPRLQVEHGVTEMAAGFDLAAAQLRLAAGEPLSGVLKGSSPAAFSAHAIEARIYAEDSLRFLPSPGTLKVFRPPKGEGIRVETGYEEGAAVTPFYDPMIAQVIAKGETREKAISKLEEALAAFEIEGLKTNIGFLRLMLRHQSFIEGSLHTSLAEELVKSPGYKEALSKLEGESQIKAFGQKGEKH